MVLDEGQEDNPAAAGTSEYEKEGPEARPCWTLDASVWCQFGFFRGIVDERARSGQPLESGDELRLSDDVHEIMDVVVYRCRIRSAASAKDLAVWYEQLLGAVGQARMLSLDPCSDVAGALNRRIQLFLADVRSYHLRGGDGGEEGRHCGPSLYVYHSNPFSTLNPKRPLGPKSMFVRLMFKVGEAGYTADTEGCYPCTTEDVEGILALSLMGNVTVTGEVLDVTNRAAVDAFLQDHAEDGEPAGGDAAALAAQLHAFRQLENAKPVPEGQAAVAEPVYLPTSPHYTNAGPAQF
jgi:hypothetical protein